MTAAVEMRWRGRPSSVGGGPEGESHHLRQMEDGHVERLPHRLLRLVLVGVERDVAERAGGRHRLGPVRLRVQDLVPGDLARGRRLHELDREAAAHDAAPVVDGGGAQDGEEVLERVRFLGALPTHLVGRPQEVAPVEGPDLEAVQRARDLRADRVEADVLGEDLEEVLDLGRALVLDPERPKGAVDPSLDLRIPEADVRQRQHPLAGRTDRQDVEARLLGDREVACVERDVEHLVRLVHEAGTAAGEAGEAHQLDAEGFGDPPGRHVELLARLLGDAARVVRELHGRSSGVLWSSSAS